MSEEQEGAQEPSRLRRFVTKGRRPAAYGAGGLLGLLLSAGGLDMALGDRLHLISGANAAEQTQVQIEQLRGQLALVQQTQSADTSRISTAETKQEKQGNTLVRVDANVMSICDWLAQEAKRKHQDPPRCREAPSREE
jgi:hypothetical protein